MSFPQNIDMSLIQQNLLIGGLDAAEACSDLGVTHIVTVDTIVPEATFTSSVVHSYEFNNSQLPHKRFPDPHYPLKLSAF